MEIVLTVVGKTTSSYLIQGMEMYLKRLRHYIPFKIKVIPDLKKNKKITEEIQKNMEGNEILSSIMNNDYVILLDENGSQYTSIEFAEMLQHSIMLSGIKRLVFIVGGPYGFSQDVYKRANRLLSLSKMTFNHEMVRLFFIEQLYRGMTIIKGEPYHHE